MAIIYNSNDNCYWGTNAERLAITLPDGRFPATSKFKEYDLGGVYVTDGTTWYAV